jgi:hypothetical protein
MLFWGEEFVGDASQVLRGRFGGGAHLRLGWVLPRSAHLRGLGLSLLFLLQFCQPGGLRGWLVWARMYRGSHASVSFGSPVGERWREFD